MLGDMGPESVPRETGTMDLPTLGHQGRQETPMQLRENIPSHQGHWHLATIQPSEGFSTCQQYPGRGQVRQDAPHPGPKGFESIRVQGEPGQQGHMGDQGHLPQWLPAAQGALILHKHVETHGVRLAQSGHGGKSGWGAENGRESSTIANSDWYHGGMDEQPTGAAGTAHICAWCAQPFRGRRNARHCPGPHWKQCENCGEQFIIRDMKRPPKACSKPCSDALTTQGKGGVDCICELCGKTFQSDRRSSRFCGETHQGTCVVCGEGFPIAVPRRAATTCSPRCAALAMDVETAKARRVQTSLERFGTENPSQSPEIKEQKRVTNLSRRGVENPSQDPQVQLSRLATFRDRLGVDSPMQSPEVRARHRANFLAKHGVENPFQLPSVKGKARESMLEKYGMENIFQLPEVQRLAAENSGRRISRLNLEWQARLEAATGLPFELEVPIGAGTHQHADLGHGNLLIDINPSFTHNSAISFVHLTGRCKEPQCTRASHAPRPGNYHRDRARAAEDQGKVLMQFFDWMDEGIFVNLVQSKVGRLPHRVHARQCEVRTIGQPEANRFLADNHLLGGSNGQTHCLGLFLGDKLVHVQTYGPSRFNGAVEWEAIRSCSLLGHHVPGAFSRCDAHFFRQMQPISVISYVDLNTGVGHTEGAFPGWRMVKRNRPSITWVRMGNDGTLPPYVRDSAARRLSADRVLGFEVGMKHGRTAEDGTPLSNADVLLMEGYVPVHDAGTKVFLWERPNQ